jgi:light-regulated signal transduction histidine kinase (bacteriophytochrome)
MLDALSRLARVDQQVLVRSEVDMFTLAGQTWTLLSASEPSRRVEWRIELLPSAQADPDLAAQVWQNLLGNAWKYTAKSRAAEVWLLRCPQRPDTYTVRDNGAGFDMRFADRLFGVFQRLHSSGDFQGTGVGLASVRRIVRRHGGEIWAESEVGHGARFYFTLK